MLEFTRKVNIKSFTFTRILAHIADIMEGDASGSNEILVPQNVLLEDLLEQTELYKEQKIQKELADFKNFDDHDFIIGKYRQEWSATNRLSVEDIGEIHKEIFSDRGIQGLFAIILKVINADSSLPLTQPRSPSRKEKATKRNSATSTMKPKPSSSTARARCSLASSSW